MLPLATLRHFNDLYPPSAMIKLIALVAALLYSTSLWAEPVDRFIPLSQFLEEGGQLELRDAWHKGITKSLPSHNHLFKEFLPARILRDTSGNVTLNFSFFPQSNSSTCLEGASRYGSVRKIFKLNDQPIKGKWYCRAFWGSQDVYYVLQPETQEGLEYMVRMLSDESKHFVTISFDGIEYKYWTSGFAKSWAEYKPAL